MKTVNVRQLKSKMQKQPAFAQNLLYKFTRNKTWKRNRYLHRSNIPYFILYYFIELSSLNTL